MRMTMTHKQLTHALCLARHGNFTQAAKESNLSQPAFSRSIMNLERALGVRLFDRDASTVSPTRYGEVFLERAATIIADTEELKREISLMQGLAVGHFSVSMGIFPAEVSGNRALGDMINQYPSLTYRAQTGNWETVGEHVLSRNADLGFALATDTIDDERLVIEPVSQHEMVLFCKKSHPLAGQRNIMPGELSEFPLVSIRAPAELSGRIPGRLSIEQKTGMMSPAIEIDDFATARATVKASNSISAAVPLQIEQELEAGEFVLLDFQKPWIAPVHAFIRLRQRAISPAAEKYMELVRQYEQEATRTNQRLLDKFFS
jgi:DNA-binding transcriptional LysR family regulator